MNDRWRISSEKEILSEIKILKIKKKMVSDIDNSFDWLIRRFETADRELINLIMTS